MRISIVLAMTGLIFLSSCGIALAFENDIGYSKLDPSSTFYFLKTVREDIELKLALTPHVRVLRQIEFSTRRIREVRSLVKKDEELIVATLERYAATINTLLDKRVVDEDLSLEIGSILATHLDVLQNIYKDLSNDGAKRSVRATINRIILRPDIPISAKIPACNFLKKEASSSALNQAQQVITMERAKKCLGE